MALRAALHGHGARLPWLGRCLSTTATATTTSTSTGTPGAGAPLEMRAASVQAGERVAIAVSSGHAVPTPQPGEVLVRVHAAGVNRPDILQRLGKYPPPQGHSEIIGLEVSGVVAAAEPGSRWQVGDRVCALANGGGYAEYCSVPQGQCLPVPPNLSLVQAAALPETFFTVWHNVAQQTNVFGDSLRTKKEQDCLVHGGSSGIGVCAIQLLKALGHRVVTTVSSKEKATLCTQLGADLVINHRTVDFAKTIEAELGGLDYVLDMVGGSEYTGRHLALLREEGRISVIGSMGGYRAEANLWHLMRKRLTLSGSTLRPRDDATKASIAAELEAEVWPLLATGQIVPCVNKAFPFEAVAEAHALMESSRHLGKIVLRVADEGEGEGEGERGRRAGRGGSGVV